MSRLFPLETFAPLASSALSFSAPASSNVDLEAARLEAFDTGYKSGWDDAASAQSADQKRIGEEFAEICVILGSPIMRRRRM